jgi:hypothetical protein
MLPLAGDADEGCQWKVQTDEGWTLYWDLRLRTPMGGILYKAKRMSWSLRENATTYSDLSFEA